MLITELKSRDWDIIDVGEKFILSFDIFMYWVPTLSLRFILLSAEMSVIFFPFKSKLEIKDGEGSADNPDYIFSHHLILCWIQISV